VLSRDGKFRLVLEGTTTHIFETATGASVGQPLVHASRILYSVFSPAGDLVATTSDDNTARIWKTITGEMLTAPLQDEGDVLFAAFFLDGAEIVTASQDRTARLWDVATGEPLSPSWLHDEPVVAAEFRSDRNRVFTRELSGRTFQWDISPDTRPFETIQLWAQVMSGSRFVKDRGVVPIGAEDWRGPGMRTRAGHSLKGNQ
jgi:eukaryotic-like serine/threonine-protein kinase